MSTLRNRKRERVHPRSAFSLVELLTAIAIIGLLVSLLLPAVQSARESGRRMACTNNLHQLALAMAQYEHIQGVFTPAYISDVKSHDRNAETLDGPTGFAWGALLLPHLEQGALYSKFRFDQACQSSTNRNAAQTPVAVFLCPSATMDNPVFSVKNASNTELALFARSHYVANAGREEPWGFVDEDFGLIADGPMYRNARLRAADITDGLSNTVFLGEHSSILSSKTWVGVVPGARVCSNDPERFPHTSCDLAATLVNVHSGPASGEIDPETGFAPIHPPNSALCHVCQMYAEHPGGGNVALGDGSVRFIGENIHQPTWAALSSYGSGDTVSE